MKPELECAPCVLKWVYERAGIRANDERRFELFRRLSAVLSRELNPETNVALLNNQITRSIDDYLSDSAEYYEETKLKSNQIAHQILPAARNFIEKGRTEKERIERACFLASGTNIAPTGAPSEAFKFQEALNIMKWREPLPILKGDVYEAIQKAARIFYLADNAGEIGFDGLLIAKLMEMGLKVTLIVKEALFFEDATMKDVVFFNLHRSVDEILTVDRFFLPGQTTNSLEQAFQKSDLIITKGTGNYEALKGEVEGKQIIYMLKVKCNPVAKNTEANIGSFVVKVEK